MKKQFLIFTDLDGTLLDQQTYNYQDAREALLCIKEREIPLIFCSSKTRPEIEVLRRKLDNHDPFIVENGAAIFIPKGLFDLGAEPHIEIRGYDVIVLGTPYETIKESFRAIKEETDLKLLGFSEMGLKQVARTTGLRAENAALAKSREYSEPFLIMEEMTEMVINRLEQAVRKRKLHLVQGGRFFHLLGDNDKGKAVRLLKSLFQKKGGLRVTVGLGDSRNDFPMLENVDIPVLIRKKNGYIEPWSGPTHVYHAVEIGPTGWNSFILHLLKEVGHE